MSATNTTTNYNLPIFIETDKPAWLVDFNGAMRSIDAQMKTNADAIATKSPILTFNDTADIDFTKSGDIITANLSSGVAGTVSRALLKPVSAPASEQLISIDLSGNQENLNIGNGFEIANGVINTYDFNLDDTGSSTSFTVISGNVTTSGGTMRYAFNSDKSIGKIYGYIDLSGSGVGNVEIDTGITVNPPEEQFDIASAGIIAQANQLTSNALLRIDTSGHIKARAYKSGGSGVARLIFFPSVLFFENFGD